MTGFPMIRSLRAAAFALALVPAATGTSSVTLAAEQPNLLIVGEDADRDTVPRGSRIFNRVLAALTTDMTELGFKVYDETAAGMDITRAGRVRRTDAELISVAQRIAQPPIDAIVVFQIYASVHQNAYSDIKEIRVRIAGRMTQVHTGRALGNFEVAVGPRGLRPLPVSCNRDCILEHVGDEAKPIAHEVGLVLAHRLDELSPTGRRVAGHGPVPPPHSAAATACVGLRTAYTIALTGFAPDEAAWIEQTLVAFRGYEHHRPLRTMTRFAEYWYETCADHARLERGLRFMLDQIPGPTRLAHSGNRFELERIPDVGQRRQQPDGSPTK